MACGDAGAGAPTAAEQEVIATERVQPAPIVEGPIDAIVRGAPGIAYALGKDQRLHRIAGGAATALVVPAQAPVLRVAAAPDRDAVYVATTTGVSRSLDAGATWAPVFASADRVIGLAAGPLGSVLVSTLVGVFANPGPFRTFRSEDAGASWNKIEDETWSMCGWNVRRVTIDRKDPKTVYRMAGCYAGRDLNDDVELSKDGGAKYTRFTGFVSGTAWWADEIVGGADHANPSRFYTRVRHDLRGGVGSGLWRTDDRGATWKEVLRIRNGDGEDMPMLLAIAGVPAEPDHLFAGVSKGAATLRESTDGGATFHDLGDYGAVSALAWDDAGRLLVASSRGLFVRP